MIPLPLKVRPRPYEPAHGLLLRLGARNGYRSSHRFARSLGLDFRRILTGASVACIANAADFSVEAVASWSPRVHMPDRRVTLCHEKLAVGDWSTSFRRYCPVCLDSDVKAALSLGLEPSWYAAHQAHWDVRSILTCRDHGVELLEACFRCDRKLGWSSTNVLSCSYCQADLTRAPSEHRNDRLGSYLSGRLTGTSNSNPVLDLLPLHHVVDLCERLAQIRMVGALKSLPRQSARDLFNARETGFLMTSQLELLVNDDLDQVIRRSGGPDGLLGAYGWIYGEWLAIDDAGARVVQPILLQHAIRHGVISAQEPRLGATPPATISMTQAARTLGMGFERARAAAETANLIPTGSRRGVAFTINPQDLETLRPSRKGGLSPRGAASLLRTGRRQIGDLLSSNLVKSDEVGRLLECSIEQLLCKIERQCCRDSAPPGVLAMSQAARNEAVPLARIVAAAIEGIIPCWRQDGMGLAAFVVRPVDIAHLRTAPKQISVEAAARQMGVHPECARALARCGTLADGSERISAAGIKAFKKDFIVGAELARRVGRSPKRQMEELKEKGIKPAFDLSTHRQAIFRRQDVAGYARPT